MVLRVFLGSRSRYFLSNDFQFHDAIVAFDWIRDSLSSVFTFNLIFCSSHIWKPNSIYILFYTFIKLISYCRCRHRIIPIFNPWRRWFILIAILFELLFTNEASISWSWISSEVCYLFLGIVLLIIKVVIVFVCLIICSIVVWGSIIVVIVVVAIIVLRLKLTVSFN